LRGQIALRLAGALGNLLALELGERGDNRHEDFADAVAANVSAKFDCAR
jgi:hypothetical protein